MIPGGGSTGAGGNGGFNGTSFIGDEGGVNLSGLPFVGGLFPNAAQRMQRELQTQASNTMGAMRPGIAEGFQNIWNGVQQAYNPAQQALMSIYGGKPQGGADWLSSAAQPIGSQSGGGAPKPAPPDPWSTSTSAIASSGIRGGQANPGGFMGQIPIVGGMMGGMGGMMPGGGGFPGLGGGGMPGMGGGGLGGMIPGMGGQGGGPLGGLMPGMGGGGGLGGLLKGLF